MFVSFLIFFFNPRIKSKQLAGKICLIYCIALAISLIVFYGPFIKEILTKTIPSVLAANKYEKSSFYDLSSIGSSLLDTIFRVIRYHPVLILPLLIAGFLKIRSRYSIEKNRLIIDSLYIWIFVYILLAFLRSGSIFSNLFIKIPDQLFIYPLSSVALGIGVCRLLYSKEYGDHRYTKMKKTALLSTLGLWVSFNLFWYYAVRIGMIHSAGYLPKWLKLFV
jgi:hypothetical protein